MKPVWWIAALLTVAVAVAVATLLIGGSDAAAETGEQVVYLCRETGRVVAGPPQSTPAVNSATGRPTLYRALYCPQCQTWRVVPPSEVYGGNPLSQVCPRHRTPMSPTGPLPEGAAAQ